jgi:FtsZ-binding cell division protein ZapB
MSLATASDEEQWQEGQEEGATAVPEAANALIDAMAKHIEELEARVDSMHDELRSIRANKKEVQKKNIAFEEQINAWADKVEDGMQGLLKNAGRTTERFVENEDAVAEVRNRIRALEDYLGMPEGGVQSLLLNFGDPSPIRMRSLAEAAARFTTDTPGRPASADGAFDTLTRIPAHEVMEELGYEPGPSGSDLGDGEEQPPQDVDEHPPLIRVTPATPQASAPPAHSLSALAPVPTAPAELTSMQPAGNTHEAPQTVEELKLRGPASPSNEAAETVSVPVALASDTDPVAAESDGRECDTAPLTSTSHLAVIDNHPHRRSRSPRARSPSPATVRRSPRFGSLVEHGAPDDVDME